MTIQRQYSLPNCKLVLQGLGSDTGDLSGRPLMSMVTNVECYLAGQNMPLTGGRVFLESLVAAVSNYAQGYLSGIHHLIRRDRHQQSGLVQIQQVGHNLHRLTVHPELDHPGSPNEVDLTTVQLFDLVEAVDQLYADAQTLPDLSLQLDPLPKRHVVSTEPLGKRAVPVAVGASSLAAAAAVLFMLPAPEVRRPEATSQSGTTEQTSPEQSPGASPSPTTGSASPEVASSPTATSSPTDATSPTPSPTDASSPAAADSGAGLNLANAPEVTDPTELDRLTVQLYDKLDLAWKKTPTFDGQLIYRVGVNPNGDIVGYKYGNDASLTYLTDTPLMDVQFTPPAAASSSSSESSPTTTSSSKEPIAQFRVVFKSDGVLEVSPWNGQPEGEASPSPSP